jgi:hypothetical protein
MNAADGSSVATPSPGARATALDLFTRHPGREGGVRLACRVDTAFPRAIRDALARLGQVSGMTPDLILFAALNALLYRYTRRADLVVGWASGLGMRLVQTDLDGNWSAKYGAPADPTASRSDRTTATSVGPRTTAPPTDQVPRPRNGPHMTQLLLDLLPENRTTHLRLLIR